MTDPSLEQKIEHNRKRRKDNFEASSRLDWKDVRLAAEGGNKAMERWSMQTQAIQDYVGDEDCFSVGKHYIPNQYFKCPDSGIEMVFRFRIGSGWAVGPPEGQSCIPVLRYTMNTGKKIPFPETPRKYQKQERKFYDNLKKLRELDL